MKSKSNQKRMKRSFRAIKGGTPVTRSQVEIALVSAQDLVRELSSMLSFIEQEEPLPILSIETNLESAKSLVRNLKSMLMTVKKETNPLPTPPAYPTHEFSEQDVLKKMEHLYKLREENWKWDNRFQPFPKPYPHASVEDRWAEAVNELRKKKAQDEYEAKQDSDMWFSRFDPDGILKKAVDANRGNT
jgi:hypothetical protein